ncbi:MoaD/ThiS family protein [Geobacter pickeringii]|uniref:Molybdenum cofactor biosynthesis protein MoaD n=1 Tax=Geobacter pickeringii TaxID=345632 RepID=A0A0B5B949_9BACT|nr:MoaD/ThiS family protein [Geobacter pickeringii]AJE03077.1 molybdenum cofactor biosynthesis protein MoaD [Geobacter pickeringii]
MNITVKLFATFRTGRFDIESRDYAEGTTVADVVRELSLAEKELGIMLVNSRHVKLDHRLAEGDTLALFPLLGGG